MKALLLTILALYPAFERVENLWVAPPLPQNIQDFIQTIEVEKEDLQGGAIAILYKGRVVYKTTFGYQKGETDPITPETLFTLASVSKPVSATALALLVKEDKIDLDQPVRLPYLEHEVTLKHILSHTTGHFFKGNLEIERGMKREKLLEILEGEAAQCLPGEEYCYSNIVFSLIEDVLNTRNLSLYQAIDHLRSALNTPGIQVLPLKPGVEIAYPHVKRKEKKDFDTLSFPSHYSEVAPASAGVYASLDGMIALLRLQLGYRPDLISRAALSQFYRPHIENSRLKKGKVKWPCSKDQIEAYYGLGWRILRSGQHPGQDLVYHGGYLAGGVAFVGFVPSKDAGIIILVNQGTRFATQKGIDFWGAFLK